MSYFENSPGEYSIEIELAGDVVLSWSGYADNPSDALYRAIDFRNEVAARIIREIAEGVDPG